MDETGARPYAAPAIDPDQVKVSDPVEVQHGVGFAIVTDAEAFDSISQDLSQGRYPDSYRPLIQILQSLARPGGRVLDLGTHIGTFSLAASALGYEVLGVEASPRNAALLQASIERNRFDRFRLVHAAVSDAPGSLEFCQGGPYGHVSAPGMSLPTVTVPALRVDDLLAEVGWDRVDFIKMDIEGSEVAGLRGMARLLSGDGAPPLFVESNGHTLEFFQKRPGDLKAVLEGFGYRNYLVESGRLYPVSKDELQPTTCVDYLALKGRPKDLRSWRIDRPLSRTEVIRRVVDSCLSPNHHERSYIARALVAAPPMIRAARPVRAAVEALRNDPNARVREAAQSVPRAPLGLWFARFLR